jgi:hypothetical protein
VVLIVIFCRAVYTNLTWAQRLKRVFNIDICKSCGGHVKIIACIEDLVVIEKILTHLKRKDAAVTAVSTTVAGSAPGALVRLRRINHASSRCDIEAAGSLSPRAWKRSKYRAKIQDLCRPSDVIWASTASKRRFSFIRCLM